MFIDLEPHEHFTRDGDDLHYALPVGVAQAALGSAFEVPTLDGRSQDQGSEPKP